jgi:hypothetical protein
MTPSIYAHLFDEGDSWAAGAINEALGPETLRPT